MRALYWFKLVHTLLELKEMVGSNTTRPIDEKVTALYYGWLKLIEFEDNYPETTKLFYQAIDTSTETTAYAMLSDDDAMALVRFIKTDLRHYGYEGALDV